MTDQAALFHRLPAARVPTLAPDQVVPAIMRHVSGLIVSQGAGAGDAFDLWPWERQFVAGAFAPAVKEAALSIARGNGKTTLLAAIAHAAIDGPLVQPRAEVVVIASSFEQARLTFDHVLSFGHWPKSRWRVWNSHNTARIESTTHGARLRCLGSDPRRAHGLAPALVLTDEPAQWPPSTAERMVAALRTALGKISGARLVALGTRPASSDHWFERMCQAPTASTYAQVHSAPRSADVRLVSTWAMANPSMPYLPELADAIRAEAQHLGKDGSALAAFRALRLNQGVPDVIESLLLEPGEWLRCESSACRSGPWALGIDLGGSAAMSAAAGYWPDTGRVDALAAFSNDPPLEERGRLDSVGDRYVAMAERGELLLAGDRVVDVSALLRLVLERWGRPSVIVADRWRAPELRQALDAAGFPQSVLVLRGQGFLDGGADVREFRRACLADQVRAPESLLLRSAIGEARVTGDPAGNWKLAKGSQGGRRARARDDAAAAVILAVAEGCRRAALGPARSPIRVA